MREYKKSVALSPSNFFLIQRGSERIRIRRGMTKEEVRIVLGEPFSINKGSNPNNLKYLFKFSGNGFISECYELLFREDFLEWSVKIK